PWLQPARPDHFKQALTDGTLTSPVSVAWRTWLHARARRSRRHGWWAHGGEAAVRYSEPSRYYGHPSLIAANAARHRAAEQRVRNYERLRPASAGSRSRPPSPALRGQKVRGPAGQRRSPCCAHRVAAHGAGTPPASS